MDSSVQNVRELRVVIELSTTASCGVMMMMTRRRLCTEEQTPQNKTKKEKRKEKQISNHAGVMETQKRQLMVMCPAARRLLLYMITKSVQAGFTSAS